MSFGKDGFLSPNIKKVIDQNRAANTDWFALCARLRRLSQSWLMAIKAVATSTAILDVALPV